MLEDTNSLNGAQMESIVFSRSWYPAQELHRACGSTLEALLSWKYRKLITLSLPKIQTSKLLLVNPFTCNMFLLSTVIFLNIRTPKIFVVTTLKFELCGSSIEQWVQRCRRNGKQCRPWSDSSTVCTCISVRKLRIITVHLNRKSLKFGPV